MSTDADDDSTLDQDFDFSPWGRTRWQSWGRAIARCRPGQIRFAAARWRGLSALESAKRAGYKASSPEAMQQCAFRLDTSKSVTALLQLVRDQVGTGDGVLSEAEARLILTDQARSADGPTRISAIKALAQLDGDARKRDAEERARGADAAFLVAIKSAPLFGVPALAEMYLQRHGSLPFGSQEFRRMAPLIAGHYPDTWNAWKARLPGHGDEMDALAAADLPAEFFDEESADTIVEDQIPPEEIPPQDPSADTAHA